MRDDRPDAAVSRILRLLAEHLENFLEGDELALETLGEALDQGRFEADELRTAALVLRSVVVDPPAESVASLEGAPGERALRVPSHEERTAVSPEAWGYLIDLRRRGSLDSRQLERVLDLVTGSGVRPVDVRQVREVAAIVALEMDHDPEGTASGHGEVDLAH
jgi:hypothetical protein